MKITIPFEQIESILEKANFSPSGDNCQPWEFNWDGEVLLIYNVESRSRHPLDPQGATSVITLGCVIESIIIAASALDLRATYSLNNQIPNMTQYWAEIKFEASEIFPDELLQYISKRTTDRRLYQRGIAPTKIIEDINTATADSMKARVHITSNFSAELEKYIVDSEQFLVDHPKALPEVLKWVRFSIKSAAVTGDGISWRNMLAKCWELPLIILFRILPGALNLFRPFLVPQFRKRAKEQLLSSAALICVSIPKKGNSIENAVDAGRLMMRSWLSMTKIGYGSHPFTLSSMPIFYKHQNVLDDFFTSKLEHIKRGENILRSAFSISEDRLPIWVLRTGVSAELPENMRTFRRPLSKLIEHTEK